MKPVFVDASFYLAILNRRDAMHLQAAKIARNWQRQRVTTEFVLVEVGNGLSGTRHGRDLFLQLASRLKASPTTEVIPASEELFAAGLEFYRRRRDKSWGMTDCISFVLMQRMGLNEALTADSDFEQAGFTILLS